MLETSKQDLSLFHMNIRSHSLHFDELCSVLSTLKIKLDVIGVSETWNSFENPMNTNVEIPGYRYFPCPSHTQNGGVALYVTSELTPVPRPDLSKNTADFESVWVEVENNGGKTYLFCCVYRHPSSDVDTFYNYLQETLSNKQVCSISKFLFLEISISTF